MDWDEMSTLYRGPPIDASYQVSVHLAKRFQRRRFLEISQSISSRSIDKHGHHRQFLFLIGRFLKIFYSETAMPNGPKCGRKRLWKVLYGNRSFCFDPLTNMEMSNLYRGHSIDASYQVSYHLAKRCQRKSCFRNRPIRNKN
jgi:hypothetical protein